MTERNAALLRKVGDHIAAEPDAYNQRNWAVGEVKDGQYEDHFGQSLVSLECGTTCCIAGTASLLDPAVTHWVADYVGPHHPINFFEVLVDGEKKQVMKHGREVLGLTEEESTVLFSGYWRPVGPDTVPLTDRVRDALYALADGASVGDVTYQYGDYYSDLRYPNGQ